MPKKIVNEAELREEPAAEAKLIREADDFERRRTTKSEIDVEGRKQTGFEKAKVNRDKRAALASRTQVLPPRNELLTTRRNRGKWREEYDEAPWMDLIIPRPERIIYFCEELTVTSGA